MPLAMQERFYNWMLKLGTRLLRRRQRSPSGATERSAARQARTINAPIDERRRDRLGRLLHEYERPA
jgi:hypothetical protein